MPNPFSEASAQRDSGEGAQGHPRRQGRIKDKASALGFYMNNPVWSLVMFSQFGTWNNRPLIFASLFKTLEGAFFITSNVNDWWSLPSHIARCTYFQWFS